MRYEFIFQIFSARPFQAFHIELYACPSRVQIKDQPLDEPCIAVIVREVLLGLRYLNSENKIHRDIKGPSDICIRLCFLGRSFEVASVAFPTYLSCPFDCVWCSFLCLIAQLPMCYCRRRAPSNSPTLVRAHRSQRPSTSGALLSAAPSGWHPRFSRAMNIRASFL